MVRYESFSMVVKGQYSIVLTLGDAYLGPGREKYKFLFGNTYLGPMGHGWDGPNMAIPIWPPTITGANPIQFLVGYGFQAFLLCETVKFQF